MSVFEVFWATSSSSQTVATVIAIWPCYPGATGTHNLGDNGTTTELHFVLSHPHPHTHHSTLPPHSRTRPVVFRLTPHRRRPATRQAPRGRQRGRAHRRRRSLPCAGSPPAYPSICSSRYSSSSGMAMRRCSVESRSRSVTVPSPSSVSKSMVTQKGVPASSMRRYRLPMAPVAS